MTTGPDFSHGGEFVEWDENVPLDERFDPLIETARLNLGMDVELCRWSPDDPLADKYEGWWARQRRAIKAHVGSTPSLAMTLGRRTHRRLGMAICYVRFNRKRLTAVRSEVAS